MKIKGIYIVLFLLLLCLFGTTIWQYRITTQIEDAQETALNMQSLLEASDNFSSNVGSVQQYFRNFVTEPSTTVSANLLRHKGIADSALAIMKAKGNGESTLRAFTLRMDSAYFGEGDRMIAYLNSTGTAVLEKNKIIAGSEARMDLVWTVLFEYRKLLKEGIIEKSNNVHVLASGSERVSLISIFLLAGIVLSGVSIFFQNRKHDLQIKLMHSLLNNTTTSMHIVDTEGRILFVNRSFLDFIGLKLEEVMFKPFKVLQSPKTLKFEKPDIRVEQHLPPFELEETVEVEGDLRYFFTRKHEIKNAKGETFASAIISRDITERTLSEKGLEVSRQEAEHARLTQEQFMANISHEIRTPMNGIVGMTDLLSDTLLDAEQRDYLDTIKQSSTNLIALINDILDFSKIEAGMLQIEQIPFKVSSVIDQSINSLKVKANVKEIYLNYNVDHKVPSVVIGDPLRLYQIISNLLSNAIKFTTEGGVTISVSAKVFRAPMVKLIIKVCDTGIGIPEERINYIFNSFAQSSLDITRKFGGTGLGLTIVKQLVEMQGGSVAVESKIGFGSCFTVDIPFETALPEHWLSEDGAKFSLLRGKEVLIVEDNLINQKVIIRTLENAGLVTTVVDNGFSALDILKQRKFHMVIMDIQMPDMDGRETTSRIRNELVMNIPVIAMTASVSNDDREKCLNAGMDDYIAKPFVKEDLFEKLLLYVD